mmetsp:Transcript_33320/g.80583  ORF Transcript_33320/g.80583 Transcript_33320/m.80583 type:complete len:213 (+) Transcript_33320:1601-2239(+)
MGRPPPDSHIRNPPVPVPRSVRAHRPRRTPNDHPHQRIGITTPQPSQRRRDAREGRPYEKNDRGHRQHVVAKTTKLGGHIRERDTRASRGGIGEARPTGEGPRAEPGDIERGSHDYPRGDARGVRSHGTAHRRVDDLHGDIAVQPIAIPAAVLSDADRFVGEWEEFDTQDIELPGQGGDGGVCRMRTQADQGWGGGWEGGGGGGRCDRADGW